MEKKKEVITNENEESELNAFLEKYRTKGVTINNSVLCLYYQQKEIKEKVFNSNLRDLEEFFERERRLPRNYVKSERFLYYFMTTHKKDSRLSHLFEAEKIIEAGWKRVNFKRDFQEFLKYYYTHGKLPDKGGLFHFMEKGKKEGNLEITNFIDFIESRKNLKFDEEFKIGLQNLRTFCKINKDSLEFLIKMRLI